MPTNSQIYPHVAIILAAETASLSQLELANMSLRSLLADKCSRLSVVVPDSMHATNDIGDSVQNFDQVYFIPGENRGKGTAYLRGSLYAARVLQADLIVIADLDNKDLLSTIPSLLNINSIDGYPVAGVVSHGMTRNTWTQEWLKELQRQQAQWCGIPGDIAGPVVFPAEVLKSFDITRMPANQQDFLLALVKNLATLGNPVVAYGLPSDSSIYTFGQLLSDTLSLLRQMRQGKSRHPRQRVMAGLTMLAFGIFIAVVGLQVTGLAWWSGLVVALSTLLFGQGVFTLGWMVYAWQHEQVMDQWRSPKKYLEPKHTFTAILPARHEETVIAQTVQTVAKLNYPSNMCEVLVVCRSDDQGTIAQARAAQEMLEGYNVRVLEFSDGPINKPRGLNVALEEARGDVVVIFDAEDQPDADIYRVVNTMMIEQEVDVVQSGVQLMNYDSRWFSPLNVLEYFFWFKSGLPFLSRVAQVIPLGGNTVFFRRDWLKMIDGWDDSCLTEDADIGIRLSRLGVRLAVTYDEDHVTQEETPLTVPDFIKQRSRWDQGFLQIFTKGDWRMLPSMKQRFLARYILLWPFAQAALALYMPLALLLGYFVKLPVGWSLLSLMPLYILIMQLAAQMLAFEEFMRRYYQRTSWKHLLIIMISFLPYQLMLGYAALRSLVRFLKGQGGWEKTTHANMHRQQIAAQPLFEAV